MEPTTGNTPLGAAEGSTNQEKPVQFWKIAGLIALLAAASVVPFMLSSYRLFQFSLAYVYAIAL
jgi:hypothetical protein